MTNNQIKYMIEIAKTGSINQAARNLFISQSAMSNAIQSVEAEFGHKIFNRSTRGVTLTSFGKLFIAYITPIDQQLSQLYAMKNTANAAKTTSLTVVSNGFYYISDILAALGRKYAASGVRLTSLEDYSGNLMESLTNHSADIGVVRLWSCYETASLERYAAMKLLYHPICELHVGVDVGPQNPLYEFEGDAVTPDLLKNYPQIVHESLDCGPYADILSRLSLPPSPARYITNTRIGLYELLASTDGYSLNSRRLETGRPGRRVPYSKFDIRFIPFAGCQIRSKIGWLSRENSVLSPVEQDFVAMLKDYLIRDIYPNYND